MRLTFPKILLSLTAITTFAAAQTVDYWHTAGNQIYNSSNQAVRIAGLNWYGFETTDEVAHGLWAQDYHSILNTIKSNGYTVIRMPLSNQMVETPIVPTNISYNNSSGPINTDLMNLNSLQILDKIVSYAGQIGLRIILDNHRSEAGSSAEANGLWYTSAYPESAWINDWTTLATRYLNNSTVIGFDLRNEPHNATSGGSCWGCGTLTNDWRLAAERSGNAVQAVNPKLLIFVEGTDCYNNDCDWWGGNLEGAQSAPVVLNVNSQLVYSAHDYGPNLYQQSWFNSSTTYASLVSVWTKYWAYLSLNGTAPVWVGEFGTTNNNSDIENSAAGSQGQWFQSLVTFLQNNPALNWTYWALNGEDTYALLDSNYDATPANPLKQQLLATIQSGPSGGGCTAIPSAPTGLKATAASASQINLSWTAVTPGSGCSITYQLYSSTTANFTPSPSNRIATGLIGTTYSNTGLAASTTYYYIVTAVDSAGQSGDSNQASATTKAGAAPNPPSNLGATSVSTSQINLSWTASSTPGVTYSVYSSKTSGFTLSSSNRIATGVTATTYSNAGLTASTTYYYLVTAVDSSGQSAPSNQAGATTQSAGSGLACHVTYTVDTQWNDGFTTGITIENTGTTNINGWSLTWSWSGNQAIYQSWNSNYAQTGANPTLTNASWNAAIAPGATVTGIGFNASYSGSNTNPTTFHVNGVLCQ